MAASTLEDLGGGGGGENYVTSPIFPSPTSAVRMDANTIIDRFYNAYSLFVPINGKNGVYRDGSMAFDSFHAQKQDGAPFFANFQTLLWLLEQSSSGTPDLLKHALLSHDRKLNEILKDPHSYQKGHASGSLQVNPVVAGLYAARLDRGNTAAPAAAAHVQVGVHASEDPYALPSQLEGTNFQDIMQGGPAPEYNGERDDMYMDEGASRSGLGANDGSTRPKFDIVLVPTYGPPQGSQQRGKLVGMLVFAFCFDQNWSMIHAYEHIVHELQKKEQNQKHHLICSIDEHVAKHLTAKSSEMFYARHFAQMTQVDPDITAQIARTGTIILDANSQHNFERLWSFDLALRHLNAHMADLFGPTSAAQCAAVYKQYESLCRNAGGYYLFPPEVEAYAMPLTAFHWNRVILDADDLPIGRTGIYSEWLPWVAFGNSDFVQKFSSNSVNGQLSAIHDQYHRMHKDISARPIKSSTISIERSQLNSIQALMQRAAPELKRHRVAMSLAWKKVEETSPTLQSYARVLSTYNEKARKLEQFESLITRFLESRVLSLDVDKPLTDAVRALIAYVHGVATEDPFPLMVPTTSLYAMRQVGVPVYKMDPKLDTFAHWQIERILSERFIHGIADSSDSVLFTLAANDSMRQETGLHVNIAATGPAASSKSKTLEQQLRHMVPGTFGMRTSKSKQSDAVDLDRSDMLMVYDEAPSWYVGTGSSANSNSEFTPEASEAKAKLSQGYNTRETCEVVKHPNAPATRAMRLVTTHLSGGVIIVCNIKTPDSALASRFCNLVRHAPLSEMGGTGIKLICDVKVFGQQVETGEELLKLQRQQQKLSIEDLMSAPRSLIGDLSAHQDFRNNRINHALTCIVQKMIECGGLDDPSDDMSCVTLFLYKWQKTFSGTNLRALVRLKLLLRQAAIQNAVNLVMNTPGVSEEIADYGFTMNVLRKVKPHLWVTMQMAVSCFAMVLNEFMQPLKMVVAQNILARAFGGEWDLICLAMQARMAKAPTRTSTVPLSQAPSGEDAMDLDADSETSGLPPALKKAFESEKFFPVEALFTALDRGSRSCTWKSEKRRQTAVAAGPAPAATTATETVSALLLQQLKASSEATATDESIMLDLNYLLVPGGTMSEITKALGATISPGMSMTDIESYAKDLANQAISVDAVDLVSVAALRQLPAGKLLPRRKQNLQLFIESDRRCYVCVHLLDHVVNSGLINMLTAAIQAFVYKGMKPRKLFIGSRPENMMPHFTTLDITQEMINDAPESVIRMPRTTNINKELHGFNAKMMAAKMRALHALAEQEMNRMIGVSTADTCSRTSRQTANLEIDVNFVQDDLNNMRLENQIIEKNLPSSPGADDFFQISEDIDDWACRRHFARIGIPMSLGADGKLGWLKENGTVAPFPTPQNLIALHKEPPVTQKRRAPPAETPPSSKRVRDDGPTPFIPANQ